MTTSGPSGHSYGIVEIVGTSTQGLDDAIQSGIASANQRMEHLDWFEVRQIRGQVQDGRVAWYQVTMGVGFRVDGAGAGQT